MSNSEGSRTQARIYRETNWGETPSTGNKMKNLNLVSENFTQQTNTQRSQIIRSDTNTPSVNRTGIAAAGDLATEMHYAGLDELWEGTLRSLFSSAVNVAAATTIAAVATGNHITDSGNGFTNIVVGQWIRISGFVTSGNNGYARVLTKASNGDITIGGLTLANESAGPAVTIKGQFCKNGTTNQSFLVEVERTDIGKFKYFSGMRIGTAQFAMTPGSLINGSFSLRGKQMGLATATQGDGSPTAASTNTSLNAVDNIHGVYKDLALSTLDITNFSFTINPNLRDQAAIGNLPNIGIGTGTISVQLQIEAYMEDNTLLTEYAAFTQTDFAVIVQDAAGNAIVFDFPQCAPANGTNDTKGIDTDTMVSLSYEAYLDSTLGFTVGITKIPA